MPFFDPDLAVGDLIDVEGGHLYRVTAVRRTDAAVWVKWHRIARQTLELVRVGRGEHVVDPSHLARYQRYQILSRNGVTVHHVRLTYPVITPDLL